MKPIMFLGAICAALLAARSASAQSPPAVNPPPALFPEASIPAPREISPNRYVIYAPDGSCKITIDTTQATDMTDWAEHRLAPVLAEWYPIICAILPTPGYTAPTNWSLTIAPGNGVAATGGTRVSANYPVFRTRMDKEGPISTNEIKNLPEIVEKLRKQSDPLSAFLWKRLTASEQAVLIGWQPSASNSTEAAEIILQAFNKVLSEPSIYEPARFNGIPLTYETIALLQQSPQNVELSHINRRLLEDAYALASAKPRGEGVGALLHEEVHVVQQYGANRGRFTVPGNFGLNDITNLPSLASKLLAKADPVSVAVNTLLTSAEREALAAYHGPGPADFNARTNLVAGLNRIMRGPSIYNATAFKDVTLRDTAKGLLDQNPQGADLAKLNRALLEDAYPGEFAVSAAGSTGRGRGGNTPGWLTEGIPDYIRWFLFQPGAHGADLEYFSRQKADPKYDGLYRQTAYFLDYVTHQYDPSIVTKLSDACRQGKYYEAIWYDNTGKTLQELNLEWLDMFHKAKAGMPPPK